MLALYKVKEWRAKNSCSASYSINQTIHFSEGLPKERVCLYQNTVAVAIGYVHVEISIKYCDKETQNNMVKLKHVKIKKYTQMRGIHVNTSTNRASLACFSKGQETFPARK